MIPYRPPPPPPCEVWLLEGADEDGDEEHGSSSVALLVPCIPLNARCEDLDARCYFVFMSAV